VLLLDLMMPGLSGFEVLRQVRADPQTEMTPVIVMTSASDARTKLRVLELGATDFLEKPVDPSELVLRLRNTLAFKAYRDRSAWFDLATGLPNRRLMISQTASVLRRRARDGGTCALILVEVGRLRQLNETLGHRAADAAVRVVAQRIQRCLRDGDPVGRTGELDQGMVVSRAGNDEFVALIPNLKRLEDAAPIARRVLEAASGPVSVERQDWYPVVSIGIAAAPADADEAEALLRCARAAAAAVRDRPGGGFGYYSAALNEASVARMRTEAQLRRALEREEFELHYQPKVDVARRAIVGSEALVRWRHPERGLVSPEAFITIAEEAGLIVDLGSWVLGEACRAARRWYDAGCPVRVSVNVASPHFRDGRLLEDVERSLSDSGLPPHYLTLELTESMLMGPTDEWLAPMQRLKALGVSISLDDFGTGYSSLAYLRRMPIDELKVDRSFVAGLPDDEENAAIVRAVVALADSLDLTVVAEGVETPGQAAYLQSVGCVTCQGWLYARAEPEAEFFARLRAGGLGS
jgi:diguanylate cyclase (GGDEF)-like protein